MTREEMAKYRVIAEQLRRARRVIDQLQQENAALKKECEALRMEQSEAARAFDSDSEGFFKLVHQNHNLKNRETRVEVFYPCLK